MQLRMNGRNALITGGSLGIGRAIAKHFAGAGANVAIVARNQDPLDEAKADIAATANVKVATVAADVGTAEGCRKAYEAANSALGQIDVLVNNAGTSQRGPFLEVSDEVWQHDIDLKLFAAIRLCRQAFPGMKARRWGRIINVLNIGAKAPAASSTPTSVSRAAGMALTKAMANEGAAHNILVNAMLVGLIVSDQWVKRHAKTAPDSDFDAFTKDLAKAVPMGRMGTAEEFANLACFLASDQGSYITGTAINVDGGRSPVV
jgi:3-oxoacyl-[acyl-carrier protein] reductase